MHQCVFNYRFFVAVDSFFYVTTVIVVISSRMPLPCPNCKVVIKPGAPSTPCDGCRAEVHISCVGLSTDDIRVTRNKSRNIKIICNSCNRFMGELGDIKTLMCTMREDFKEKFNKLEEKIAQNNTADFNSLQTSISQLQADFNNFKNSNSPNSSQKSVFDEVFQEFNERQKRKCNLIVFGVPENPELSNEERVNEEKSQISEIIRCSSVSLNGINDIKPIRLGRHIPNKTRPIKVTLESEEQVRQIIGKAKDLKSQQRFTGIFVSFDKTPRQIEQYRQVKNELEERKNKGESNIKITYFNGVPTIKHLN